MIYLYPCLNLDEHVQDEAPIEVKTAPQGSTILMECKTDLEQPVSYEWSRQGKALRNDIDIHSVSFRNNNLTKNNIFCTAHYTNKRHQRFGRWYLCLHAI